MTFACWAIIASFTTGYYWIQYNDIRDRISGSLIDMNLGIDYGNGSRIWHNETKTFSGQTLFDVTTQEADITYRSSLYGAEVLSIDGVVKNENYGWTYWIWNGTISSWSIVWESASNYLVANGETFMWYYQTGFNPPP